MGHNHLLACSDRHPWLAHPGRYQWISGPVLSFWPRRAGINGLPMRAALSGFLSGPVPVLSDRYHAQPERIPYIVTLIHYPLPEVQ